MMGWHRWLFLLLFPCLGVGMLSAQNILDIDGTVRTQDDGSKLPGVHVTLLRDGQEMDALTTEKNGKFRFWLDSSAQYLVVFAKNGYATKRISVNTYGIRPEDAGFGFEYKGWNVRLFPEIEGMDYSILEKPFARIVYDTTQLRFVYDVHYIEGMKKDLAQLERDYEAKKKEIARAEAAAAKAQEAEDRQYNKLISAATRSSESGDDASARKLLWQVLALRPGDVRATHLLKEAQLRISGDSTDKALLLMAYKKTLAAADSMHRNDHLAGARTAYQQATRMMPGDKYPVKQLKKVEKQIASTASLNQVSGQEGTKPIQEATLKERDVDAIPLAERKKMSAEEFSDILAQRFPEGMTEDVYTFGNKVITRRIIVSGGQGNEYRRVRHNWGGVYYFKNGNSVTERVWHQETDGYAHGSQ